MAEPTPSVPTAMLTLVVKDIGERGFEVSVTAYSPAPTVTICAPTLTVAMQAVKDMIARQLWGENQPPPEGT